MLTTTDTDCREQEADPAQQWMQSKGLSRGAFGGTWDVLFDISLAHQLEASLQGFLAGA